MKTITKVGLVFLTFGIALQFYAYSQSNNSALQGSAFACLFIGIVLEIIGYALDENPKGKK